MILQQSFGKKNMKTIIPKEVKITSIREVSTIYESMDKAEKLVEFWRNEVTKSSWYNGEQEAFVVFNLDSKLRIKSFNLVSMGLIDQTLAHARETFRAAIVSAAKFIIVAHNHPSGDSKPSPDDIRVSRDLAEAGRIVGITVLDSIVIGEQSETFPSGFTSLKNLGII